MSQPGLFRVDSVGGLDLTDDRAYAPETGSLGTKPIQAYKDASAGAAELVECEKCGNIVGSGVPCYGCGFSNPRNVPEKPTDMTRPFVYNGYLVYLERDVTDFLHFHCKRCPMDAG